jgi:putative Mg2+ transporter-C (MgtC) family protein
VKYGCRKDNWFSGMFDWTESFIWLGKLILAALLGGAIGFERESHGQAAGLRTNLLVTIGSCLMMMLSLHIQELYSTFDASSSIRVDPGRIASYAVAGMGFLGGGAIIKGRGSVKGLTTAASLWMNTGVGLSIGAGYLLPAIYATGISLVILYNLRFIKVLFAHDTATMLSLTCTACEKPLRTIKEILRNFEKLDVGFVNYRHDLTTETVTYRLRITCKTGLPFGKITGRLTREVPGLKELAWEEGEVP